jgi:polyphosphate glucokinase
MPDKVSIKEILSVDIGGSHIKATILNITGELLKDYEKVDTPKPADPENVVQTIKLLSDRFSSFDCVSVGFPGYVRDGIVKTAPNLGTEQWRNVDLRTKLE